MTIYKLNNETGMSHLEGKQKVELQFQINQT